MEDVIYLKNGAVLRGTITQNIPGKFIRIESQNQEATLVRWDEVDKVASEPRKSSSGSSRSSASSGRSKASDSGSSSGARNSGRSGGLSLQSDVDAGYRGLVETGVELGVSGLALDRFKLNVINGYQFVPVLITGFGVGMRYYYSSWANRGSVSFPMFLDLRAVFLESRFTPYASFGIGYTLNSRFRGVGLYLSPNLGVRYYINDRLGLNFGLGYEVQRFGSSILRLYSNAISLNAGFSF